jgi:DNA-binding GntR family transcriptional regulator
VAFGRDAMLADTAQGETIGEAAYRRIRADIVFGRLAPGEKLKLDRVSEAYGVSISTLRELLNRLCSEGLTIAEGQRGFEVAPVSAEDFQEVAAMRQLLECHALEQSFQRGDLDWEGRIVAAHHKLSVMEKRMIAGDRSEPEIWKRCDWQFHHALISACGSKVLLATHAAIYDKYLRYQMVAVIFRGEIAAKQHQKLLECALARDFATARQVLVDHVQGCVQHAIDRGTDWVTASAPKRASDPANARGRARGHQTSRRADRPASKRTSSARR